MQPAGKTAPANRPRVTNGRVNQTSPDQPDRKGQVTGRTGSQTGGPARPDWADRVDRARRPVHPLTARPPAQGSTLPSVTRVFTSFHL